MARNGNYYWVFAHVTPSFDRDKRIVGYHSNRRVPDRQIVETAIVPVYSAVLQEERKHRNGQTALTASFQLIADVLKSKNVTYDEFIFSL